MLDSSDAALIDDPTEKNEANEPTLPIESTDPMLPIDRTEPVEPIDSNESLDAIDHLPLDVRDVAMPSSLGGSAGCAGVARHGALVTWLEAEHGLGHGHANAVVAYALGQTRLGS